MLEGEIYEWLNNYGIPVPDFKLFELNANINVDFYPVALKIQSPKVIHKSDVGGVITDIKNSDELKTAQQTIIENLNHHGILLDKDDKLIVTKMYKGIELFFGIVNDKVFEKVIVFGTGGIFVEVYKDVCFIDSEAADAEIKNAILQTKISELFTKGFRGLTYDINLIVDFVKKLQKLEVSELDFNPVILTGNKLTVVDARVKFDEVKNTHKALKYSPRIFKPQRTAIIGVSGNPEKVGYALAENTLDNDNVYFVNPKLNSLLGKKVYQTIKDLPEIDTALIAISTAQMKDTIEQLVTKGVKNVIIITAGFKEAGQDERFLTNLADEYNINIIGPNCFGIFSEGMNLTFGTNDIKSGEVNFFSQSGAIISELMDKAAFENIGFENIISVGNMADIDFADLINSYEGTNVINLYVEGIENGKNLLRAIRKSKSLIKIVKAGKTKAAQKAAFSHTGNLSGNYEMFVGLMKSVGVKMLNDTNGLIYPYNFEKIIIVTNAGGAGTVMSDLISNRLYELTPDNLNKLNSILPFNWSKNNPIDIIGDAVHERYLQTLKLVDDFNADAIYVIVTPQLITNPEKVSEIFVNNTFKTKVFPILLGGELIEEAKNTLRKNKIIFFEELNEAVSFL